MRSGRTGGRREDPLGVLRTIRAGGRELRVWSLPALEAAGVAELTRLPYCTRVLLENVVRHVCEGGVAEEHVRVLTGQHVAREIPFLPARVLLQDLTGVPCLVDLAAMRAAMLRLGLDPRKVNPKVQVDLVVDHSLQVDEAGRREALNYNMDLEFGRNEERYRLFKWAQGQFENLQVVPPGTGIVHQVNLEHLASLVTVEQTPAGLEAFPDSLVGTDSHTTMVSGLGVLGWGVGGIEAEAVMLGQPYFMLPPRVVAVRLTGRLRSGVLATDLALTVTELLRKVGVVGAFVEFFGPGVATLSLPDRATVANMAPEYGATTGFFPADSAALQYLRQTGRSPEAVATAEAYLAAQRLLRTPEAEEPEYQAVVELDLGEVGPSVAGPRRPQDRMSLSRVPYDFSESFPTRSRKLGTESVPDGAVVIAAITSCTNTANPRAMVTAGLLARNAHRCGLRPAWWVKTSLTPGSRAVGVYLERLGLLRDLEALGFAVVGYACATCIGNSGELLPGVETAVREDGVVVASVLSGNRNFEARVHPLVRANYLASPALVVAYALAGSVTVDLTAEPLAVTPGRGEVFLSDLWPADEEVMATLSRISWPEVYRDARVAEPDVRWTGLQAPQSAVFPWNPSSTYLQEPPFVSAPGRGEGALRGLRILALLGDSVTTDHISPAGRIAPDSPAGRYLQARGVPPTEFNTYGSRRGNHEVLVRGTFASPRLRNFMARGKEGGYTTHHPSGDLLTIFEAAQRYGEEGVSLVVVAGKEYGTGSSRDWAAKGPALLGVRAVIAESFERIHRSNLVGMGILPLEFLPGENAIRLGLEGDEVLDLEMESSAVPAGFARVVARSPRSGDLAFRVRVRLDSATDVDYWRAGGILPYVFRKLAGL